MPLWVPSVEEVWRVRVKGTPLFRLATMRSLKAVRILNRDF